MLSKHRSLQDTIPSLIHDTVVNQNKKIQLREKSMHNFIIWNPFYPLSTSLNASTSFPLSGSHFALQQFNQSRSSARYIEL